MKAHLKQHNSQYFFHRYLVHRNNLNSTKNKIKEKCNEQEMMNSFISLTSSGTSLHKCRLVNIGQQNIDKWQMYLLKRISYLKAQKSNNKKSTAHVYLDQNVKSISQIRTQYLCYQIMNKSHRVVKMIQFINENQKNLQDKNFFYNFLNQKKQIDFQNACFILEFCNNGNLQDRINDQHNELDQDTLIMYCCQILQGLIQIKKKGILHRDLRPCNIFLHNNQLKFGDFDSAFIYKESECSAIKNGIDINTTPQQIVQLASLSDQQLQEIGNIKLYQLQSKCDIYFFGMIIFKMVFKRQYQKKFEGTDVQYLVRQKINQGFLCPRLLQVMIMCLYANVDKRIDLVNLYQEFKKIQIKNYFNNSAIQQTYLSEDPLNLFTYNSLQANQLQIMKEIQSSISNTFTLSFASVQYNFQADFKKVSLNRSTKLYVDQVNNLLAKHYRIKKTNLWSLSETQRFQMNNFLKIMQNFVIDLSKRAYYYDYLYKVILKINTKTIQKKQQKNIVIQNQNKIEKQLIILLKFIFELLGRTPFKIDKNYDQRNLPYEVRKLFKEKIKINNKISFFNGRAKTFNIQEYQIYKLIKNFYNLDYQQKDHDNFAKIYENFQILIQKLDKRLNKLLMQIIIDLFRPYENAKNKQTSHYKEIFFIMITLEKQKLQNLNKGQIVMIKQLLQPLYNGNVSLNIYQAQMFFNNYKKIHQKQVQESRKKQNIQMSFNLLGFPNIKLDCLNALKQIKEDKQNQLIKESVSQDEYYEQKQCTVFPKSENYMKIKSQQTSKVNTLRLIINQDLDQKNNKKRQSNLNIDQFNGFNKKNVKV